MRPSSAAKITRGDGVGQRPEHDGYSGAGERGAVWPHLTQQYASVSLVDAFGGGWIQPLQVSCGWFTLLGFFGMYAILAILFLFLVYREIEHGPEPGPANVPAAPAAAWS